MSRALQEKGVILKPFVIGIGLDSNFIKSFECIGHYYDASSEETFRNVIGVVISQALNSTTAQVNLLDVNGKANETNTAFTLYNQRTGAIEYNYVHTMNDRGKPDTLKLDPVNTYRMVVHTIPEVTVDSLRLEAGTHNILAADAPQGALELKMGRSGNRDIKAIVRQKDKMQTLNVQGFEGKTKYLVGTYDLEVLTLPRTYIEDVKVNQSHTTTVEVPAPGNVTLNLGGQGYGTIFQRDGRELKWVTTLPEGTINKAYKLQPGNYVAVFRRKASNETIFTIEKEFKVSSGSSTNVRF